MYVSPCAAHYYRQRFERMSDAELAEQRRLLQNGLQAIEEERAEVAGMAGREAAKLRGNLERDAVELRAKLAAVDELMAETAVGGDEQPG